MVYEIYAVEQGSNDYKFLGCTFNWGSTNCGDHFKNSINCMKPHGDIGNFEVVPMASKNVSEVIEKYKQEEAVILPPKKENDKMLKIKEVKELTLDEFKEFETTGEVGSCRVFLDVDKLKQHQEDYGKSWEKWYQLSGSTIEYLNKALIVSKNNRTLSIPYDFITHFEVTIIHER